MPKPRLPQRNFKGPTPEGVIQTVSIGEADGGYLLRVAEKQKKAKLPRREYVAVDPRYGAIHGSLTRNAIHPWVFYRMDAAGVRVNAERDNKSHKDIAAGRNVGAAL